MSIKTAVSCTKENLKKQELEDEFSSDVCFNISYKFLNICFR